MSHPVATTPEIDALIGAHVPVSVGVSGGKDSQVAALAVFDYLDRLGHAGPRILTHADLGRTEWSDSLAVCQRLATYLGCELVVVRRSSGDMLDRWESRWEANCRRYINLERVTLVLPWSTPSMRFCTSELKTHIIRAELRRRFLRRGLPEQAVINVTGVRRQESAARANGSIASCEKQGQMWNWRPISDWTTEQVFERIAMSGLAPHVAYAHSLSRVSCMYCIMQSLADQIAAAALAESHDCYRSLVGLEIRSTYGFQGSRWLADVAPHLLSDQMRADVLTAKKKAAVRIALEKSITKEMLFAGGRPTRVLTAHEATVLANVRSQLSALMGFDSKYLDASSIQHRYAELMARPKRRPRRLRRKSRVAVEGGVVAVDHSVSRGARRKALKRSPHTERSSG